MEEDGERHTHILEVVPHLVGPPETVILGEAEAAVWSYSYPQGGVVLRWTPTLRSSSERQEGEEEVGGSWASCCAAGWLLISSGSQPYWGCGGGCIECNYKPL